MKLFITGALLGLVAITSATSSSTITSECTENRVTTRKEWRHLTGQQQQDFLDALQCLMDKPAQSGLSAATSRFSDLQALHRGMTNTEYADIIHHVVRTPSTLFHQYLSSMMK
jgi:tyrosinase